VHGLKTVSLGRNQFRMQIWKKVLKAHGALSHNSIFREQATVLYQKASAENIGL